MKHAAALTWITLLMGFASAKYIRQRETVVHKVRHIFPLSKQTSDVDQNKGLKFPHRRPPPWSNSHSQVHKPQPMQINQHTSTTGSSVIHTESLSTGLSTEQNKYSEQSTIDSDGLDSFSEWQKKWMSKHTSSCGRQHFAPYGTHYRIMGGVDARKGSWPWMVSIYFAPFHQSVCGGFLIDNAWFLTAAHCFDPPLNAATSSMLIRTGLHNVTSPLFGNPVEQQRQVQKIYKYPGYGTSLIPFDNDIALVKLNLPVETTEYVRPLCLPSDVESNLNECVITGWGIRRTPNVSSSNDLDLSAWPDLLQQASVPIIGEKDCAEMEGYNQKLTSNMICAGFRAGHVDSCNGDSGGPLQCLHEGVWQIKGITSWGGKTYSECAKEDQPGVYTKVRNYKDWILETIYKDVLNHETAERAMETKYLKKKMKIRRLKIGNIGF